MILYLKRIKNNNFYALTVEEFYDIFSINILQSIQNTVERLRSSSNLFSI